MNTFARWDWRRQRRVAARSVDHALQKPANAPTPPEPRGARRTHEVRPRRAGTPQCDVRCRHRLSCASQKDCRGHAPSGRQGGVFGESRWAPLIQAAGPGKETRRLRLAATLLGAWALHGQAAGSQAAARTACPQPERGAGTRGAREGCALVPLRAAHAWAHLSHQRGSCAHGRQHTAQNRHGRRMRQRGTRSLWPKK